MRDEGCLHPPSFSQASAVERNDWLFSRIVNSLKIEKYFKASWGFEKLQINLLFNYLSAGAMAALEVWQHHQV